MLELEWIFAYGSNMHMGDLKAWLTNHGHSPDGIKSIVRASLRDHRLVWNYFSKARNGGAANIEAAPGLALHGVALHVDPATRAAIDQKEGHPIFYSRGTSTYALDAHDGSTIAAWVYIATPDYCRPTPQWPTREYRQLLLEAAITHDLPKDHVAYLEQLCVRAKTE